MPRKPNFEFGTSKFLGKTTDEQVYSYVPKSGNRGMPVNILHRKVKGVYRSGGPWAQYEQTVSYIPSGEVLVRGTYPPMWYKGRFRAGGRPIYHWTPPLDMWKDMQLEAFNSGLNAMNRMNPAKPDFSAAAALYELKDVPGLLQSELRALRARMAGSIYGRQVGNSPSVRKAAEWNLAVAFGWVPLLNDIRNFVKTQREEQSSLRRIIKNAERPLHRSTVLLDINEPEYYRYKGEYPYAYSYHMHPTLVDGSYATDGTHAGYDQKGIYINKTWAEGQCRYFLPSGPRNVEWTRAMLRRIGGRRVTPSQIYAVIPWSWLVDYFFDLGGFIKATEGGVSDCLIWDYIYVMRMIEISDLQLEYQYVRPPGVGQSGQYVQSSQLWKCLYQIRVPGSVFGFTPAADLNARQLGILSALGFSKLP